MGVLNRSALSSPKPTKKYILHDIKISKVLRTRSFPSQGNNDRSIYRTVPCIIHSITAPQRHYSRTRKP